MVSEGRLLWWGNEIVFISDVEFLWGRRACRVITRRGHTARPSEWISVELDDPSDLSIEVTNYTLRRHLMRV